MSDYDLFLMCFNKFSDCEKKRKLGDIFLIDNVSIYSVLCVGDEVIFRIYANAIFYQFVFISSNSFVVKVSSNYQFVIARIYISDFKELFSSILKK